MATFLGGPVAFGYMIWRNFRELGEPRKGILWFLLSITFTLLFFGIFFMIPDVENKVPRHFVPIAYTIIAHFIILQIQSKKIDDFLHKRGQLFGWWRTVAVMLLAVIVSAAPLFIVGYVYEEITKVERTVKHYGDLHNEIEYKPENISVTEVDRIGSVLDSVTFFNNEQREFLFVRKSGETYELFVSALYGESISDQESFFSRLRRQIQEYFPKNKIVITIVGDNIDNVLVRIEPE
ncbi:MAG: hypothetical protein K0S32_3167 [Bacteroidetes bacterium]|nr:hypothetical protein [Bacteroidota bacterium]